MSGDREGTRKGGRKDDKGQEETFQEDEGVHYLLKRTEVFIILTVVMACGYQKWSKCAP